MDNRVDLMDVPHEMQDAIQVLDRFARWLDTDVSLRGIYKSKLNEYAISDETK